MAQPTQIIAVTSNGKGFHFTGTRYFMATSEGYVLGKPHKSEKAAQKALKDRIARGY